MSTPTQPLEPTRKSAATNVGQVVKVIVALAALIAAGFMLWRQFTPPPP